MRRRRSAQRTHVRVHEYEEHEQYEYDHMYGVHYADTTHHLNPTFEPFDIPHHETRDETDRSGGQHYQLVGQLLQRVKLVLRTYAVWADIVECAWNPTVPTFPTRVARSIFGQEWRFGTSPWPGLNFLSFPGVAETATPSVVLLIHALLSR